MPNGPLALDLSLGLLRKTSYNLIFFIQELFKGKLLQFVLVPHTTPQSRTQTFSKIYDRLASDDEQFSVCRLKHSLF